MMWHILLLCQQSEWRKLTNEVFSGHVRTSDDHVDDFGALTIMIMNSDASIGAAADLVLAITSHLGLDSVVAK